MSYWLRLAWAEWLRDFRISLRYPMEWITGLFIMYALFMAIFLGGKAMAGNLLNAQSLEGLVIGYSMWLLALMSMNQMSIDIETEARAGTLEQVYLCSGSFFRIMWLRAVTHLSQGVLVVVGFNLLLQASTGQWLRFPPAAIGPTLLVMLLTIAGLCGFGLILGGISLVVKRIGQVSSVVQFGMLFPAMGDLSALAEPWRSLVLHVPLARGVVLLKQLLTGDAAAAVYPTMADYAWLAADGAFYVLLGSAAYLWAERIARKGGMLSHY